MNTRIAVILAAALLIPAAPVPVRANGAASTRNIILFGAAAAAGADILINHNRQVHARYAADAHRQAVLEERNHHEYLAYQHERTAYLNELAVNRDLTREVAYQHSLIVQQDRRLADLDRGGFAHVAPVMGAKQVADVSYGWGTL